MIAISGLAKSYGAQTLFEGVSFQLTAGNRYGLVGANGSGKTTLLNILAGTEEASAGSVSLPRRLRLGVLRQEHFSNDELPILEVVLRGHQELWQALAEKESLLEAAGESFDAERYAHLEDVIASQEGYSFEARAAEILEGLGIPTEVHRRPLATLSGGFKLRVLLAQTLASDPQLLLLDEPTNHLDILSIRWLEKFLAGYSGCVVVISHDHRFLDNVCSHILDIDYQTVTLYAGNYTSFVQAKTTERQRRELEIARQERTIADHRATVERFRAKATKARQAQSMLKQIERVVIEPLARTSRRHPTFTFRQCRPSGKQALEVKGLSKSFGEHRVLSNVSLHLQRGDRLAVIGPNGIGKSTLLKIVMGELPPDTGTVVWGYEAHPGYFAQDHHQRLLEEGSRTVESWLWDACPGENVGFVRSQLGRVLFSGEEVEKKLSGLSGGESTRLVLARLALTKPNVLVLDEPTNHLDLEAIESFVEALRHYDGTLLFVSHDRWFVSQLATRVLEITHAGLNDYRGTYDEYVASCGDDHLDSDAAELRLRREKRKQRREQARGGPDPTERELVKRQRQLTLRRDVVTAAIEQAEARISEIDALFCEPGFFDRTSGERVRALQTEQLELRAKAVQLLADWEAVEKDLERIAATANGGQGSD